MLYLFIITLLLLLSFHYDYQHHVKYRMTWYIIILIIFIMVAGLSYRLGIDSTRYAYEYTNLPSLSELNSFNFEGTRYGRGYLFFNAIVRSCSDDFVAMQFVHAIFINSIVFYFIYKNTKHLFFAILAYFILSYFSYNFEILRESCAVAVFLFSWRFFKSNNWLKYYCCCVVAILFHPSAMFLLILPILYLPVFRIFFRMGWTFGITCGMVFIVAAILSAKFFDVLQMFNLAVMDEYSQIYQNSSLAESKNLNILGITTFLIKSIIYPFISIAILKGAKHFGSTLSLDPEERGKLEYMLCWFVYMSIVANFIQIFGRFNNYLIPFWFVVLADLVFNSLRCWKYKIKLSFALWLIILMPYFSINLYGYFSDDSQSGIKLIRRYYPYSSVLTKEKNETREKLFRYLGGA